MIIIKIMIDTSNTKGHKMKTCIALIKHESICFVKVSYYHIKRDLNKEANHWAKQDTKIRVGTLLKMGVMNPCLYPKYLG